MALTLELEVLDQLAGGDLPVSVLRGLFKDATHFERAIFALANTGEVEIFDATAAVLPRWRLEKLSREVPLWWNDRTLRARITAAGARRV